MPQTEPSTPANPPPPNAVIWWTNRRRMAWWSLGAMLLQIGLLYVLIFTQASINSTVENMLVWLNGILALVVLAYHGAALATDWLASRGK